MSRFLEALKSGRVMLMDGAMGTELQRAGLKDGECGEHWNLTYPDRVRAIHQSYKDAGARVFLTNTFQANPASLRKHGLEFQLEAINREALVLAQDVAGNDGFVLGDIGPLIANFDEAEFESVHRLRRSLAWADALLFETWSNSRAFLAVIGAQHFYTPAREMPILVSLCFHHDAAGRIVTFDGRSPQFCARSLNCTEVNALGVNCGREIDMDDIMEIIHEYRQETDLPLFARPNAGTPERVADSWVYPRTPEQMAARLPELLEAGISMIGGCCGTTPHHIAAFRPVVEKWNASK
jgi:5-methyltetrahydrofolate--homocysteine methyltransferase